MNTLRIFVLSLAVFALACSPSGGGSGSGGGTGTGTGTDTGTGADTGATTTDTGGDTADTGTTTGGTDTGGTGAGDFDGVGAEIAEASCSLLDECLGDLAAAIFPAGNCEEVISKSFDQNLTQLWQAGVDKGTVVYDKAKGDACVKAIEAASCDALPDFTTVCQDSLVGQVATDGECENTLECAGAAYCRIEAACPGACTPRVDEGAACDLDEECAVGLACAGNVCAAAASEGAACGDELPACALGMLCKAPALGAPGVCTPLDKLATAGNGQPCDPIKLELCEPGLSCVLQKTLAFQCQKPYSKGAVCGFGVPEPCSAGEYCTATFQTIEGNCTELPGQGQPCATGGLGGGLCAAGLICAQETCETFQDLGGACKDAAQCFSGQCTDGACVVPPFCEQ